jgi:hypothetical protein
MVGYRLYKSHTEREKKKKGESGKVELYNSAQKREQPKRHNTGDNMII